MNRIICLTLLLFVSIASKAQLTPIPYSVPKEGWSESLGNHRALIKIDKPSDAVRIDFLWRRHDLSPEKRRMQIVDAETGEEVTDIHRVTITNERCELVFGPVKKSGTYYFYYLPYSPETKQYQAGTYFPPENAPNEAWVKKHQLDGAEAQYKDVATATVTGIEARSEFQSFYPMEVIATQKEVKACYEKYTDDFLVYAEDRKFPIRMQDAIPYRWIARKPGEAFQGTAQKNEYYAFQLGIVASQKALENVRLVFSDLKDESGNSLSATSFTCFNTDGVDTWGKSFTKTVNVKQGAVQALWVGTDIPADVKPGLYSGEVTITSKNSPEQKVKIQLTIEDRLLADRGDGETWRHSRLRWLNSKLGISDEPTREYSPIKIDGRKIESLGKSVVLNEYGFPQEIIAKGNSILSAPIRFVVEMDNQKVVFPAGKFEFKEKKSGIATWVSTTENEQLRIECTGEMEFDGRLSYRYKVTAKTKIHIQDIRIELPMKKDYATYMVGMGRMGGFTPKNHISRWQKTEDSFWIGAVDGGIQCELRGGSYHGPLLNLYQPHPPHSWFNGVNGGFRIDSDASTVTASAYSGARSMTDGQSVTYEVALLITPVKELNLKSQFTDRYFHSPDPSPDVLANGGKIMNVHHANDYNPFINYPFIAQKEMRGLVDKWHAENWKVKIYYTVRELSNHLTEIWALRSLGTEVLAGGSGGGYQWLQEHLVTNYTPQWYTHLGNGEVDAAILNGSESRWYNYYIEGLNWLVKNMDIDGLYLDDVSFDRHILKRMRRVMEMTKPDCMIDLHSNTAFSLGSLNQNLESFPYIDKIWFGEGFNFDLMPSDFWLTEVSGIPFGVGNDILMHMSVNNRRGMNFAMTHRGFTSMWKLWDDFGIADAKMMGFWEKTPVVTSNKKDVVVTAYVKKGKTLLSVGSWVDEPTQVKLNIDWKRLGLNPAKVEITAPEIKDYQKTTTYKVGEAIPLEAKGDRLLIISE